jgi:hypothetical protein
METDDAGRHLSSITYLTASAKATPPFLATTHDLSDMAMLAG